MDRLLRPSPSRGVILASCGTAVFRNQLVINPRLNDLSAASSAYQSEINDHCVQHQANSSTMKNQILFIRLADSVLVFLVQRLDHAYGPSQCWTFGVTQVVKSVDQAVSRREFDGGQTFDHIRTKNVVVHELFRSNRISNGLPKLASNFLISAHFTVQLQKHKNPFFPVPTSLSICFTLRNRYGEIACTIRFCAQAPNKVRRPRCDSDSNPSYRDPDRGHNYRCPSSARGPGIPPNDAIALPGRHARAKSAPERRQKAPIYEIENDQAHITPPLNIGGHSATLHARTEFAHG